MSSLKERGSACSCGAQFLKKVHGAKRASRSFFVLEVSKNVAFSGALPEAWSESLQYRLWNTRFCEGDSN